MPRCSSAAFRSQKAGVRREAGCKEKERQRSGEWTKAMSWLSIMQKRYVHRAACRKESSDEKEERKEYIE